MSGGGDGGGSLSSGSSIVTISSVAISDPDPDYRAGPSEHGDKRNIRNEKWYHTIFQVSVPFLIAGMGTIGAGRVLTTAKVRILTQKLGQFHFFLRLSYRRGICHIVQR